MNGLFDQQAPNVGGGDRGWSFNPQKRGRRKVGQKRRPNPGPWGIHPQKALEMNTGEKN